MIEVIPSEIVLSYAGFLVANGKISFGCSYRRNDWWYFSANLLYWLGYYGGRPVVEKYGKYLLINKHHLDIAEGWFKRYGAGVIFSARFIPVVRHAISIPAGLAKMPLKLFTLYTVVAIIPWSILFIYLGENLVGIGDKLKSMHLITHYIIIGAVLFIALYFGLKYFKKKAAR